MPLIVSITVWFLCCTIAHCRWSLIVKKTGEDGVVVKTVNSLSLFSGPIVGLVESPSVQSVRLEMKPAFLAMEYDLCVNSSMMEAYLIWIARVAASENNRLFEAIEFHRLENSQVHIRVIITSLIQYIDVGRGE
jgi:hypothetical protein